MERKSTVYPSIVPFLNLKRRPIFLILISKNFSARTHKQAEVVEFLKRYLYIMSLRGLPNLESRPLPRDNKKLSLLKRWTFHGITFTGNHRRHNNQQFYHTQNSSNTTTNTATMVDSSSFSFVRALSRSNHNWHTHIGHHHQHHHQHSYHNDSQINTIDYNSKHCHHTHHMLPSSSSTPLNIMHWMQNDCPNDVLPLVLAFVGPQKTAVIGRTNHFWRQILEQESTWRRLCEELYKVRTSFQVTLYFLSIISIQWRNYLLKISSVNSCFLYSLF